MLKVLIGKIFGQARQERLALEKKIEEIGFKTVKTDHPWPRDLFVSHDGKRFSKRRFGNYGEGGAVIHSGDWTFISEGVSLDYATGRVDTPEEREHKLKELYGKQVLVFPSPPRRFQTQNPSICDHLDFFLLPFQEKGIVFVDSSYYQEYRKQVDRLCEIGGMRPTPVTTNYRSPSWPCNSLVLQKQDTTYVFIPGENNGKVIGQIEDLGYVSIPVNFSANCKLAGGIRCATNHTYEN